MIRVAVIGAGHWGPNLIRNFHEGDRTDVAWVADASKERLSQVAARIGNIKTTTDAGEAIEDPSVDAVVIATPTTTHFALAKRALESGKHVLVEKPIADSSQRGQDLCDLADAKGLTLMVGHVFLFNAGVIAAKSYLDRADLGRLYYVSMVRTNLGPIRMDVNAAWDLAAHDISIVNYWLGSVPEVASATGGSWINSGLEDAVFATLTYPESVMANLHVSWLNPRKSRQITIVGDRKMLTFDDMDLAEPIRIYDKQVIDETISPDFIDTFASFRASVREGDITIPRINMNEPLRAECEHFIDCIEKGSRPTTDGDSAVSVVRTLEAMERSMRAGGVAEKV